MSSKEEMMKEVKEINKFLENEKHDFFEEFQSRNGNAIQARGGNANQAKGGNAIQTRGGNANQSKGGNAIQTRGGNANQAKGKLPLLINLVIDY